jgi:hypothetical protein
LYHTFRASYHRILPYPTIPPPPFHIFTTRYMTLPGLAPLHTCVLSSIYAHPPHILHHGDAGPLRSRIPDGLLLLHQPLHSPAIRYTLPMTAAAYSHFFHSPRHHYTSSSTQFPEHSTHTLPCRVIITYFIICTGTCLLIPSFQNISAMYTA